MVRSTITFTFGDIDHPWSVGDPHEIIARTFNVAFDPNSDLVEVFGIPEPTSLASLPSAAFCGQDADSTSRDRNLGWYRLDTDAASHAVTISPMKRGIFPTLSAVSVILFVVVMGS